MQMMIKKNKLTPAQFLKQNPDKYVMVTYQFADPIYIAPMKNLEIRITPKKEEAEQWSEMDRTDTKLNYHKAVTGYNELKFEKLTYANE